MKTRHLINTTRFSLPLVTIAKSYGFKTVGKFYNFLMNCETPHIKFYYGSSYKRASRLIYELKLYLSYD